MQKIHPIFANGRFVENAEARNEFIAFAKGDPPRGVIEIANFGFNKKFNWMFVSFARQCGDFYDFQRGIESMMESGLALESDDN